jgi:hypothetical protein
MDISDAYSVLQCPNHPFYYVVVSVIILFLLVWLVLVTMNSVIIFFFLSSPIKNVSLSFFAFDFLISVLIF